MSEYKQFSITNNGLDIIAEAEQAKTLIFTSIILGDGQLAENDIIKTFTAVKQKRLSVPIAQIKKNEEHPGQVTITGRISNEQVEAGFFLREIGVMAKAGADGEERLFAYAYGGNYVDYMPNKVSPINENFIDISLVTGNASEVTAVIDKTTIYVTRKEFEEELEDHNNDENAHPKLVKRMSELESQVSALQTEVGGLKALYQILAANIGISTLNRKVAISTEEPSDKSIWIKVARADDVHTDSLDNQIVESDSTILTNPEARIVQADNSVIVLRTKTGSADTGTVITPDSETVTSEDVNSIFED